MSKMRKRYLGFCIILVIICAILLTACDKKNNDDTIKAYINKLVWYESN